MSTIKIGDTVILIGDIRLASPLIMTVEAIKNSTGKIDVSEPNDNSKVHVAYSSGDSIVQRVISYGALAKYSVIQDCGNDNDCDIIQAV